MKLKQQPGDFQVEELPTIEPGANGAFAFYRLEKRGWTTPDALAAVRRRWKIDLRRLSYGGLKDRHAHTLQYLTILHGPKRNLPHQAIAFEAAQVSDDILRLTAAQAGDGRETTCSRVASTRPPRALQSTSNRERNAARQKSLACVDGVCPQHHHGKEASDAAL